MSERIEVTFGDVKKSKRVGKFNSDEGIGAGFYNLDCEVTKAEYGKNKEGKEIKSAKGSKLVVLNCKINDGKSDTYFNVKYYETDFSPKLKDITPTDKLKKFVRIGLSNGGEGFGSIRISNYIKEGKTKSSIEFYGANVNRAIKQGEDYVIKTDESTEIFEMNSFINMTVKGFIEKINDTEKFIDKNFNEEKGTIKFKLYAFENSEAIPVVFENIDKEKAIRLVAKMKESEGNVVGINGDIKRYFTKSKIQSESTDEFESGKDDFDITTAISVGIKEDGKYKFKVLNNNGTLTVKNEINNDTNAETSSMEENYDF
jgi:hypothetical protein